MNEDEAVEVFGPGSIIAVRLLFARGEGTFLVEREEDYSLFAVERFCWMNAGSMFEELGGFESAFEMQSWPSREAFDAWLAVPGNSNKLAGFAGQMPLGYVGPLRLSDNAGA